MSTQNLNPPTYDGLVPKDNLHANISVTDNVVSKNVVSNDLIGNVISVDNVAVANQTVSDSTFANNAVSTTATTDEIFARIEPFPIRVFSHNSVFMMDSFPNWSFVNFTQTIPNSASYPGGTPIIAYTVPKGKMAFLDKISRDPTNPVLYSVSDSDGTRYFMRGARRTDITNSFFMDECDQLEIWNGPSSTDPVDIVGAVIEFDKTPQNGGSYQIVRGRGTADDFPISYTVPEGHNARFAPFVPYVTNDRAGGDFDIEGDVTFGYDHPPGIGVFAEFTVKVNNNRYGEELSLSGTQFQAKSLFPPVQVLASGSVVELLVVENSRPAATLTGYTTLFVQDMSFIS